MFIQQLLENPYTFLRSLLIMLPGMLFALSLHEAAHAYVAYRCGDPTAKYSGRLTLNPLRHINPLGLLSLFIIGFGWAKPVPVNPQLFKNKRRDDLKVSLAGITANLLLFFICFALLMGIFSIAITKVPQSDSLYNRSSGIYALNYSGERYLIIDDLALDGEDLFRFATGLYYYEMEGNVYNVESSLIKPVLGAAVEIIYEMLAACARLSLSLAVFNLIPIPPLDGYHVLNDLVLKQDLFAQQRTARIAGGVLMALIMIGNYRPELDVIGIAISGVTKFAFNSFAALFRMLAGATGLF